MADQDELADDNEDHTVVQARHHLQTQHAHTTAVRRSKRLSVAPHIVTTPLMRNVGDNSPIKVRKRQRMSQMQNREDIRQPQQPDLPDSDLNGADGASQTKHNKARLDNAPPTYPTVVYEHGNCRDIWCAICGTNATGSSDPIAFFKGFMGLKRHILRSHKPKGPFQLSDEAIWRCIAFREISAENQAKIQVGAELDIKIELLPRGQVNTRLIERHLVDPESIGEETIVGDTAIDTAPALDTTVATALAAGTEAAVPVKTKVPRMPTIVEEGTSVSNIAAVFCDQKSATGNDADTRDRVTKDAEAPIDGESAVDTIVVADPRRKRQRFSLLGRSSRS